jgi:putative thioredoxin
VVSAHSFDSTAADFDRDVLEASKRTPVVVDFWAPWCGPCRALKPILEKLAAEFDGKFLLAKVNTDENPEIAARYGVRGIPNVKAFVDGKLANEFTGAQPESAVRRFLETLVPSPAEQLRRGAQADLAQGDFDAAETKLREAIALDGASDAARVDLAALLAARQDLAGAEAELAAIPEDRRDERAAELATRLAFERKRASLPDAGILKSSVDAEPDNLDARLVYAERLVADGQYRAALDELMEVVRRDRGDRRERAREAMVQVFGLAADQPDVVTEYRRKLASALH